MNYPPNHCAGDTAWKIYVDPERCRGGTIDGYADLVLGFLITAVPQYTLRPAFIASNRVSMQSVLSIPRYPVRRYYPPRITLNTIKRRRLSAAQPRSLIALAYICGKSVLSLLYRTRTWRSGKPKHSRE
jgi:hypothetical protein